MLGVRDLLVKQRTMLINAIRGHAAEFGVTAPKGPQQIGELLRRLAAEASVPALAREMIEVLAGQLELLNGKLKAIEARLMAWHRQDQTSQCLATIPGIGPIGGVSFALKVPDAKAFRSARHFAAWVGITPRENSTGGKPRLGKISREGDESLRRLLVLGATAVIQQAKAGPRFAVAVGSAGAQAKEARGGRAGQQDGPHRLGHDGQRRDLSPSKGGLSPPATGARPAPGYDTVDTGTSGASKDSDSKMAIGRSEDRDNPGNPLVLRHRVHVWGPIRASHLGQRSSRPHHKGRTYDRNRPDPSQLHRPCKPGAVHIWVPGSRPRAARRPWRAVPGIARVPE